MNWMGDEGGREFAVMCHVDGLRLSLMPADGRGIGLSVEMDVDEAEGLIEVLKAEVAAARARAAQASDDMRRIAGG